jgi:hypothetical protein
MLRQNDAGLPQAIGFRRREARQGRFICSAIG